jgi:hypothetical protein
MDGVQDSLIQNNLIYGMNSNALRAYQIDATAGPKNLKIVNNTFIVPSSSSGWAIKLTEDGGGHVIFNNVLIPEGSGGGSLCVDNVAVTSDHNAVVDRFSRNGDATTISLASWGSGGDDAASFLATATALFVNAGASDYHLKTGSAAIDAGISSLADVQAPAADLSGVPRPQGVRLDMGAYESGSDITRPTPPRNLRTR